MWLGEGTAMRPSLSLLPGFVCLGLAAVLATPAAARCLASRRPIEGQLTVMRAQSEAGRALKGYQLELARPACADATDLDGAPVRLDGVRTVQILTSSAAGEQKLDSLTGERIVVAGYLDAADPERHTGDAVLTNAGLLAVPSREPGAGDGTARASAKGDDGIDDGVDTDTAVATTASTRPRGHTEIAIAAPDGSTKPYAATLPPGPEAAAIEARLAGFVSNFYLSGQNAPPELLRGIYAPRVAYFGKPVGVNDVIKDKLSYYSRWPVRAFTLKPGTLAIRPLRTGGKVYELTFEYEFKVSAADQSRSGTGYARLQVDLADGHGKIVKESGKVKGRG